MSEVWLDLILLLKGAATGLIYNFVAFPSALFISDFITGPSKTRGIIVALGISLTHILWAGLTLFALSFTYTHLKENINLYTFIGSIILFYFAFRIYINHNKSSVLLFKKPKRKLKVFFEGFIFGVVSPSKILGYLGLFAAVNIPKTDPSIHHKIPVLLGVGLGSIGWWLIYIYFIHTGMVKIGPKRAKTIRKISAYTLAAFGIVGVMNSLIGWR